MMMIKPKPTTGLRHIALFVHNLEACLDFYTRLIGMKIEWQPDEDNIYLTSGNDNFALHRSKKPFDNNTQQRLDHIGFIIDERDEVDQWYKYLQQNSVEIKHAPKTHRDGARSFYCLDPDGNTVQLIYHPSLENT